MMTAAVLSPELVRQGLYWPDDNSSPRSAEPQYSHVIRYADEAVVEASGLLAKWARCLARNFFLSDLPVQVELHKAQDEDQWVQLRRPQQPVAAELPVAAVHPSVAFRQVQVDLGVSIKDTASIFRVTRPTVYDYYNDRSMTRSPSDDLIARCEIIIPLVTSIRGTLPRSPGQLMYSIKYKGRSLHAYLCDDRPDADAVAVILAAMQEHMRQPIRPYTERSDITLDGLTGVVG